MESKKRIGARIWILSHIWVVPLLSSQWLNCSNVTKGWHFTPKFRLLLPYTIWIVLINHRLATTIRLAIHKHAHVQNKFYRISIRIYSMESIESNAPLQPIPSYNPAHYFSTLSSSQSAWQASRRGPTGGGSVPIAAGKSLQTAAVGWSAGYIYWKSTTQHTSKKSNTNNKYTANDDKLQRCL